MYDSIRPGMEWLDTDGKPIHAHGASIIYADGKFYWYGENKEKTTGDTHAWADGTIWHWGMRCYSSTDLYNWTDEGLILPPNPDDESDPMHPNQWADRPHIIYNEKTAKYVLWVKIMCRDGSQYMIVSTADKVTGPYTRVAKRRPCNLFSGDFDLVCDPITKRGYIYFERVHSDMICADLTDDYTDVVGFYTAHFPHAHPPFVREAPAFFERNGNKYLFTSGTTDYFPNPSEVAVAKNYHGEWHVLGDPHVNDKRRTSFDSQISSVFKHPHKKDLYIALADRWLTDLPDERPDIEAMFDALFTPDFDVEAMQKTLHALTKRNTSKARYVWLPVKFDGDMPTIEWLDEWRIEDYE